MAYAMTPDPADYCAPGTCEHRDCAATHAFYQQRCSLCGGKFEPRTAWIMDDDRKDAHLVCVMAQADS